MKLHSIVALALACGVGAPGAWSQSLTLDQAVQTALQQGPDNAVVAANLLAAKAGDAQAQARAGISATSSLGWQAAQGQNDPVAKFAPGTTPSRATAPTSGSVADNLTPQQATASLTLATPLTSLTLAGSDTYQTNPDGKVLSTTGASATLNQTLLTGYFGGATQAAADKSSLSYQTAVLTAQANKNKAVLTVKTAFFTLLSAQDRVDVSSQTLKQRQDALKFTQAKAAGGTATAYDVRVASAAVRSAELDLAGARNAWLTAQSRLANLLGGAGTDLKALPSDQSDPAASVDEAVNTAVKNRVELQSAILSARSSGIDAALAAGAIVPTIVLTGGVTYSNGNTVSTPADGNFKNIVGSVGVKITPPTIDAGLAGNQNLQARSQQTAFQTQADQLRKSIPVDVQDAWATWQLNGQRVDLSRVLVDNADVNRQIVKSQFDGGTKVIADWLTAEVAYSTAQLSLVSAVLTWQLSEATLQNLMGL